MCGMRCASLALLGFVLLTGSASADDDAKRGASLFWHCAACHSVEPDRHMTGPTLADLWGKKAGANETFLRYSKALADSEVIWNQQTLDAWLKNPQEFIPGKHCEGRDQAAVYHRRFSKFRADDSARNHLDQRDDQASRRETLAATPSAGLFQRGRRRDPLLVAG